ncbi:hypothetical protein SAG0110_01735 [Streptococcus agalactiae BSU167]|nr:hypothetical protein SAG0110_01735 [Streptococcus agalactiae BSU167]
MCSKFPTSLGIFSVSSARLGNVLIEVTFGVLSSNVSARFAGFVSWYNL